MKRILHILRATLVGGLLFLVPIVVLAYVIEKALHLARMIIGPLIKGLFPNDILGVPTEVLIAIMLLVLFCMLVGMFARTIIARKMAARLESGVLNNVPGYTFFRGIGKSLIGAEDQEKWEVVLVRLPESVRVGFLVEKLGNQKLAIFLPGSPDVQNGELHFFATDLVTTLDIKHSAVLKCLKQMGVGSAELFGKLKLTGQTFQRSSKEEPS